MKHKIALKQIAADVVEFADDNGFDVEISGNKLLCFLNGTQKAFASVSEFIRAMFAPQAQQMAFKEWSLQFDRAMHILWQENGGTQFHAVNQA